MKTFDPIANRIEVSFKCPICKNIIKKEINVPRPNADIENVSDFVESTSEPVKCFTCRRKFLIKMTVNVDYGEVEVCDLVANEEVNDITVRIIS